MRIAFDGTTLRPSQTGVGFYTEHLLHHVADAAAPQDEIIVVSNRAVEPSLPLPARARVYEQARFPVRIVWMQTRAPRALRAVGADVAHFTNSIAPLFGPTPLVLTIHDMSLTLLPRMHPARRVFVRPLVDLAARRARAVITVSESARRDILRLYRLPPERVHVIHEAAAPIFTRVEDPIVRERVRERYGLAPRVLLYVGTIEPRKNLPRLLEAFARLRRGGDFPHQLVCVGPFGWGYDAVRRSIEELKLDGAVRLTGYVPLADLPVLYSLCEMFVFPTLFEGFGLPVVEAMACGAPVVSTRDSSLAEVVGDAAEPIDPLDVGSIADAIARVASCESRRRDLTERGLARAQQFSWKRAAEQTLAVYRSVARTTEGAR